MEFSETYKVSNLYLTNSLVLQYSLIKFLRLRLNRCLTDWGRWFVCVDGQDEENYPEFSTIVVSGDRTIIQEV